MEKHQHEILLASEGRRVAESDSEDESMELDLEAKEENLDAKMKKDGNICLVYEHPADDASISNSKLEDECIDATPKTWDLGSALVLMIG